MSKSLGNFFTARDILKQFSAETIRMFFSQTHYAGPLNFSDDLLAAAESGLQKITTGAEEIISGISKDITDGIEPEFDFDSFYNAFTDAMDDDFNTPKAVAVVFDFIKSFNKINSENTNLNVSFYEKAKEYLIKTAQGVLGIIDFETMGADTGDSIEDELIQLFIKLRTEAKQDKNYQLADKIRDELKNINIELKDGKEGTTYKKIN